MYKSPIEVLVADIQNQIVKQQDEEIYKAVVSVGVNVDKGELLRALQYDRCQYSKGYLDGTADATPKWVPVAELLPAEDTLVLYFKPCDGGDEWDMGVVCFRDVVSFEHATNGATHWMFLPEPPKED